MVAVIKTLTFYCCFTADSFKSYSLLRLHPSLGRGHRKARCSLLWCWLEIQTPLTPVHLWEPSSLTSAPHHKNPGQPSFLSLSRHFLLEKLILLSPTSIMYAIHLYIPSVCTCVCVLLCICAYDHHKIQAQFWAGSICLSNLNMAKAYPREGHENQIIRYDIFSQTWPSSIPAPL